MADLSIFKLDSETITIKDTTARQTADSATTLATTANGNATTALNKINELESEIGALKSDLANKLYPVGSIYLSVYATNPSELFGGTWDRLKDRFLLAAGDSYAGGSTGGEAQHTLTVDEMPSHEHSVRVRIKGYNGWDNFTSSDYGVIFDMGEKAIGYHDPDYTAHSAITNTDATTSSNGGSQPHNNMPPYLAVYMWKRIA